MERVRWGRLWLAVIAWITLASGFASRGFAIGDGPPDGPVNPGGYPTIIGVVQGYIEVQFSPLQGGTSYTAAVDVGPSHIQGPDGQMPILASGSVTFYPYDTAKPHDGGIISLYLVSADGREAYVDIDTASGEIAAVSISGDSLTFINDIDLENISNDGNANWYIIDHFDVLSPITESDLPTAGALMVLSIIATVATILAIVIGVPAWVLNSQACERDVEDAETDAIMDCELAPFPPTWEEETTIILRAACVDCVFTKTATDRKNCWAPGGNGPDDDFDQCLDWVQPG